MLQDGAITKLLAGSVNRVILYKGGLQLPFFITEVLMLWLMLFFLSGLATAYALIRGFSDG